MRSDPHARAVMRLSPTDNVAVALRALKAGEVVVLDGETFIVPRAIAVGHKLAARAIAEGETIIKYGCPIGTTTRPIAAGEHVHTHNTKSSYLPPAIQSA